MFDEIAKDWHRKRSKPWKLFVKEFNINFPKWLGIFLNIDAVNSELVESVKKQLVFLDLGCGSGRHSLYLQGYCNRLIELDNSRKMLEENDSAKIKVHADMANLPFRRSTFDGIIGVASFHHIKPRKKRLHVVEEMENLLVDKGMIFITVWRFYQKKFKKEFLRQLSGVNCINKAMAVQKVNDKNKIPNSDNGMDFEVGDLIVPWRLSQGRETITVNRFYHLYRAGEFYGEFRKFGVIKIGLLGEREEGKKRANFVFVGFRKK